MPTQAQTYLEEGHLAGLVGASSEGRMMLRGVLRLARARGAALVCGPAGSGKMAVARALHRLAAPPGPLAIAGDPAELAERATTATTVVLPDLDAWSRAQHRALITHLDRGRGARVIALTREPHPHTSIPTALLHRLSLNRLVLPSLSARAADIELIAAYHLARLPGDADEQPWRLTTEASLALRAHPWRGNVRELVQTVERATHKAHLSPIRTQHLGLRAVGAAGRPGETLAELERRHIEAVLSAHDGNVTDAGQTLGIPRSTLYRKLKAWGLVGQASQA